MTDTIEVRAPGRARRGAGRRPAAVGLVVAALVGGLAMGRFLTYDGGGAPVPPPAAAPVSAGARIETLERTVAAEPTNLAARQALGVAYLGAAAGTGDPSFYALAEAAFDEADRLAPDDPQTVLGRGALALSLHRFDEALTLGTAAVAARPKSADALGVVVDAHVELGHYDESVAALQRMLDLRPGLPALSRASYARELHGDLTGAIDLMQQAETAGAGQPLEAATVATLLGDLWLKAGDLDAADAAYDRALDRSPGLAGAEIGRARVLVARGDERGAVSVLDRVVARVPLPAALVLLGELRAGLGDEAGAAEADELVRATAALEASSGQVTDLEMAVFEADRGDDPGAAVELARRAAESRPDNIYAADALAWALFRSGDTAGALPLVDGSLRLGTADPLLHLHAAALLADAGQVDRARLAVETAVPMRHALGVANRGALARLAAELGVAIPGPAA